MKKVIRILSIIFISTILAACSTPAQFSGYEGTYHLFGQEGRHITFKEYGMGEYSKVGSKSTEFTYQIVDGMVEICEGWSCEDVGSIKTNFYIDEKGKRWVKNSVECFDTSSCAKKIRHRIQDHLSVKNSYRGLVTKVNFKLDQHTNLIDFSILESSGSAIFDSAVETAVRASFPYNALLSIDEKHYVVLQDINLKVKP